MKDSKCFVKSRPDFCYFMVSKKRPLLYFMYLQDTGISVRKRVIKIFRDIFSVQPDFNKIPDMCVKMIRRVNDEDGIKVCCLDFTVMMTDVN